jgi:hypothetical protein
MVEQTTLNRFGVRALTFLSRGAFTIPRPNIDSPPSPITRIMASVLTIGLGVGVAAFLVSTTTRISA